MPSTRRRILMHAVALAACAGAYAALLAVLGGRPLRIPLGKEPLTLLAPARLGFALLIPYLFWVVGASLADLPRLQRSLSIAARSLLILVVTLALARPARIASSRRVCTVFLVDVSDSVTDGAIEEAHRFVDRAWRERADNLVRVVLFARRPQTLEVAESARALPALRRPGGGGGGATNVQAAVQLAYGLFAPGYVRRMVLVSDGAETEGTLLGEAARAARQGVAIDARLFPEHAAREVIIQDLTTPANIKVGEPFHVRARLFSSYATRARLRLLQGETINGLDGVRDVELRAGTSEFEFRSVVRVAGSVSYTLSVSDMPADRFLQNNRSVVTAAVPGRPTLLYVEGTPQHAGYLARALTANDFDVEVRGPNEFPASAREMERFDLVVLSDVSADHLSVDQMEELWRYVREAGGGFLMAGGEASFGLGGYIGTRIEKMLPVRLDTERRRDQPTLALALVIDKSGSMNGVPIDLARNAASATVEILGPDDSIEVVVFDSQPDRLVKMQPARNRARISTDIRSLRAGGGTAIFPALDMAYQDLAVTRARTKHIILLTDGQSPVEGINDLVQTMRAEGITVSTVGLGPQVERSLLQRIADMGEGRAYFTNDPYNIPRIFMRETNTVARSSVVEEYFTVRLGHPAEFLRGVDLGGAPYLRGYVATKPRGEPAETILLSDSGDPILARWRVGLGWSLAWTPDVKNRWAVEWVGWRGWGQFWAQLVREHMRQRRRSRYDLRATMSDGIARVSVDALGDRDSFVNDLESKVVVTDPTDGGYRREVPLRQTAPGRYEADFPIERFGSLLLYAEHRSEGRLVAESFGQVANPYPKEYLTVEGDAELLRRAAQATRGQIDPTPEQTLSARGQSVRYPRDLWPLFVALALALFLIDLVLRRVRLFDRGFARTR